ncbi:MAG TPA: glycosyl hydrolase family 39 [Terracidiphilus sp.]|nr:glycosyl hydrolase family 39 [Terracidiphilus sp.]
MNRRAFLQSATFASAYALGQGISSGLDAGSDPASAQTVRIQSDIVRGKLPHVWEECVGSDRAVVGLREQWLADLEQVQKALGFKSVRFHGLFNDEMGIWPAGASQPNFLYVDMVFDAMLERGVKPFVELSFMPAALASGARTIFWYRGNTTPPKDMAQWGELVGALGKHCVDRYGIQEVGTWNFEVWNEPNIVFWAGTQAQYFELYRQSVNALKAVDKRLRVGGPSTAQAAWVPDLLKFCSSQQLPIDFASTHIYPDDPQAKVFGEGVHYPVEDVIARALAKVQSEIKASQTPDLPLYITEWCSQNPAFIAYTIKSTIGLADIMSYWTFDNVFEELGTPRSFLNGSFGLLGMRGVPRPSYYTFSLLHKLGDVQLESGDAPVLATRRKDGSLASLVWNLIPRQPGKRSSMGDPLIQTADQYEQKGDTLNLVLAFEGAHLHRRAHITRIDETSGNFRRAYQEMGSPAYPTAVQIEELKQRSQLANPEIVRLNAQRQIRISVPPNGVALVELA